MKKVAILQSNYIPWKGYFDLIASVDEFIFYDEVQYTKNDWRNRNKIKTPNGLNWLTIPVRQLGLSQKISETLVVNNLWVDKHLKSIELNYRRAKCFQFGFERLIVLYNKAKYLEHLSEINYLFISEISHWIGIKTKFRFLNEFELSIGKTERLVDLCLQSQATSYVSGPSAKNYINIDLFNNANINIEWMNYDGYKEYDQLFGKFEHAVSIIDLLLNEGENASDYMKFIKLS